MVLEDWHSLLRVRVQAAAAVVADAATVSREKWVVVVRALVSDLPQHPLAVFILLQRRNLPAAWSFGNLTYAHTVPIFCKGIVIRLILPQAALARQEHSFLPGMKVSAFHLRN